MKQQRAVRSFYTLSEYLLPQTTQPCEDSPLTQAGNDSRMRLGVSILGPAYIPCTLYDAQKISKATRQGAFGLDIRYCLVTPRRNQ